jgi:hypothetical protein
MGGVKRAKIMFKKALMKTGHFENKISWIPGNLFSLTIENLLTGFRIQDSEVEILGIEEFSKPLLLKFSSGIDGEPTQIAVIFETGLLVKKSCKKIWKIMLDIRFTSHNISNIIDPVVDFNVKILESELIL